MNNQTGIAIRHLIDVPMCLQTRLGYGLPREVLDVAKAALRVPRMHG